MVESQDAGDTPGIRPSGGRNTPTANPLANARLSSPPESQPRLRSSNLARDTVHEVSVEVAISHWSSCVTERRSGLTPWYDVLGAVMIVSVWSIQDTQYFTLTFTNVHQKVSTTSSGPSSTAVPRTSTGSRLSKSHSSESSSSLGHRLVSSNPTPKALPRISQEPHFPPRGPSLGSKTDAASATSIFQKASQMKDAILNSIDMPAYGSS